jgi:hypothetical protein
MDAHGWRRGLKDVGDQALMRGGLGTAFPTASGAVPDHTAGVGTRAGREASVGHSSPVVPPPPTSEWVAAPVSDEVRRLWPP